MRVIRLPLLVAAAGLALTACATPQGPPGPSLPGGTQAPGAPPMESQNLVPSNYTGRFQVLASVLESPAHGPQLCNVMAMSYPPQCGGPDIPNWDWTVVTSESFNGTTWGGYLVTGTWDTVSQTFTLTEPAVNGDDVPASARPPEPPLVDFASPCPTPPGGWVAVDPSNATNEAMDEAMTLARQSPEFAGAWLDQSYLGPSGGESTDANDPLRYVLNMRFTGDLAQHEARIREVWGGALCLSPATHSYAELTTIADGIMDTEHPLSAGLNDARGTVELTVVVATEEAQAEYDRRYGAGVVLLQGWLHPID